MALDNLIQISPFVLYLTISSHVHLPALVKSLSTVVCLEL